MGISSSKRKSEIGPDILHEYLINNKQSVSVTSIESIVKHYPVSIHHKNTDGKIPLHTSIEHNHSIDIIKCLINHCPESVSIFENKRRLPIHIACDVISDINTIQYLVNLYPECLLVVSQSSHLPIHLACSNHTSNCDVILYLANQCPESLKYKTRAGYLPIHNACLQVSKARVIPALVDLYTGCLLQKTSFGDLPIHLVMFSVNSIPSDIIEYLIMSCPESLFINGSNGELPFHRVLSKCSLMLQYRLVRLVARYLPESVHIKSNRMKRENSLDVARRFYSRENAQIYRILLNCSPNHIEDSIHRENYSHLNWMHRSPTILAMMKMSVS